MAIFGMSITDFVAHWFLEMLYQVVIVVIFELVLTNQS